MCVRMVVLDSSMNNYERLVGVRACFVNFCFI